jgi:lipoprotein-releasing system permease protein
MPFLKRLPYPYFMAWRYLRGKRQEGFISLISLFSFLGIVLGVATLIIVMSVMNGFRHELMQRILGINGHLSVYLPPQGEGGVPYERVLQKIQETPGVAAAFPFVERQVMVMANGLARGALLRGVPEEALRRRPELTILKEKAKDNFAIPPVPGKVKMGYKLARKLGVFPGDSLSIVSPKGVQTALGVLPKFKKVTLQHTLDIGMNEYDNTLLFMPLEEAQRFFGMWPGVSALEVFLKNPEETEAVAQHLREKLAMDRARVVDWKEANSGFFSVIEVERNVMFLILLLIIIVAAFNIISSLIMLVMEKRGDIAILRTMGASRRAIQGIFVMTGFSLGFWGTVFGSLLGLTVAHNVEALRAFFERLTHTSLFPAEFYFLSRLPSRVDATEVAWIVGASLLLSLLSTLYPSWRASRLQPAEVLRGG